MAMNTETILIVFVAFTGASVLMQACVLFAIFLSLRKTAKSALAASEDFKATVLPMVHSSRELIERIKPQLLTLVADLAELTQSVKKETQKVEISISEIMERVNRQTERLDTMLTNGLDAVEKATQVVETTVAAPVRQVNGILAAIKAIVETYRRPASPRKAAETGYDPEI